MMVYACLANFSILPIPLLPTQLTREFLIKLEVNIRKKLHSVMRLIEHKKVCMLVVIKTHTLNEMTLENDLF
jgi:hypothetical protein